jgi:hypothetical protein
MVFVFERADGHWIERQQLIPEDAGTFGIFGLALNEDTLAAAGSLGVYVYEGSEGEPFVLQDIVPADPPLALGGNRLVAHLRDFPDSYPIEFPYPLSRPPMALFERTAGTWHETAVLLPRDIAHTPITYGLSPSVSGDWIAFGAAHQAPSAGAAFLFWTPYGHHSVCPEGLYE